MAIKNGDTIVVDYEGKLENGKVFDSSKHGDHNHPLEFTVGKGMVIRGFDDGVLGMKLNEEREIEIEPEDAYGLTDKRLYKEIPKKSFQFDEEPRAGMQLLIATPDGKEFPTNVIAVSKDTITIDLNHPLAGKKLIFKVTLLEIK